jgi:hypothetical protein
MAATFGAGVSDSGRRSAGFGVFSQLYLFARFIGSVGFVRCFCCEATAIGLRAVADGTPFTFSNSTISHGAPRKEDRIGLETNQIEYEGSREAL